MDVRKPGRRSGLGIEPGADRPGLIRGTSHTLGAVGETARAATPTDVLTVPLIAIGICMTVIGIRHCRRSVDRPCPVEAPLDAPGPSTRRIFVFPCRCSWWSMALADAACWVLVEAVSRSGPHNRARLLGSFPENLVVAQYLPAAFVADATPFLMCPSANTHPCPKGPARAASPASRTVALLADLRSPSGTRPGPRARTRAFGCTAYSSTAWSGAPMLSFGGAKAMWVHHVPQAVSSWVGVPPRRSFLNGGARLSALAATGTH